MRYINDYDLDTTAPKLPDIELRRASSPPFLIDHPNPGHGYAVGITYTISPTMVNEFTFGKSFNTWDYYAHDQSQISRSTMGNPPSFDNFATDPKFTGRPEQDAVWRALDRQPESSGRHSRPYLRRRPGAQ